MATSTRQTSTVRRYVFYLAVVLAVGIPVAMTGEMLLWAATGWDGFLGVHSVHDLVVFALVWMGLIGLLVQFYRPIERVTAILAMPLIMVPAAIIGFANGTELAMMGVIFGALALVALVLHPAGRSVFHFEWIAPNRLLIGLFTIGAIAMVGYGALEVLKQFTLADTHTPFQHYGNLGIAAFYVAVFGALGVLRRRDWRFGIWSAGVVAVYIGASSAVFPEAASSLGLIGGLLVVVWAVAVIGLTERARRSGAEPLDAGVGDRSTGI